MENENNEGVVKAENVPAPIEATESVEPTPAPVTPPDQSAPTPEPILTPEPSPTLEPVKSVPTLESVPVSSPAPILESAPSPIKNLLLRAKEKIQFRKRAKLEKIVALLRTKGKITNDDIEKLLHVSDATATRYLAELVKQGRLKRVGPAKQPFYQINQ